MNDPFDTLSVEPRFGLDLRALEQRLGPADRILEDAQGIVRLDRAAEREPALGRGSARVAIGVERAGEIAVPLLDRAEVEIEAGLDAQRLEGISHGRWMDEDSPRKRAANRIEGIP